MPTLQEKFEEKRAVATEIRRLADLSNDADYKWSAEDEQTWVRANEDWSRIEGEMKELEAVKARNDRAAELAASIDGYSVQGERSKVGREDAVGSQATLDRGALEARAIAGWCRLANDIEPTDEQRDAAAQCGIRLESRGIDLMLGESRSVNGEPEWRTGASRLETRAQSVGTPSAGGYTVSTGLIPQIERRMVAFNGPRQVASILRTSSGNPLTMPTMDDTSNSGADIAENAGVSEQAFALGQITLSSYKHTSGALLVSQELLEDNESNLEALIPDLLGERLGRRQAAKFTTGTGSSQAQGIVTGASAGVTAASATAIAADEIKNLLHSVDPAYRDAPSAGFMFHDNVLLAIKKLKDGNNRYLWQDSIALGTPDRLEGKPVTVNQNMASSIAASAVTILFGDFSKFWIRDVRSMRLYRLDELYRANDQTGFMAFIRSDSKVIQPNAIKKLTQAAS